MENIIDSQNLEQQRAFELIANTNKSFFLTGRAGTGKTTFLHNVQKIVDKQFVVLAPTGIAAILAGGETIHSFFGFPLEVCSPGTEGNLNDVKIQTIFHTDTIIVDEVSMVRADLIDAMDYTLRRVMGSHLPFGGKQMIFVGDMFQLPPVMKEGPEFEYMEELYKTKTFFFYKADVFKRMRLAKVEFVKVYRQENKDFLNILESVRLNKVTPEQLMVINSRHCLPTAADGPVITLTVRNKVANAINQQHLNALPTDEFVYEGNIEGEFKEKDLPVDLELRLKVGTQVMFTRNDSQKRWVNGTIATVTNLVKDEIEVQLESGEKYIVPSCSWDSCTYEYDPKQKKLKKEVTGQFVQYPLKLAWAITIHKSQGMTFDKMLLNLQGGTFLPGQLYVALSRVTSMDGLFLTTKVLPQHAHTSYEIIQFASNYNDENVINGEIECGKMVYESQRSNDYDETARQYLFLIEKKVKEGDVDMASMFADDFFNTVICDEDLYGQITEVPQNLLNDGTWEANSLAAMMNLYAEKYEQALYYAEWAMRQTVSDNMKYVKSRALTKLERYEEADEIHAEFLEHIDLSMPEVKFMFSIAMLNELHTEDSGIELMQMLVKSRKKYNTSILAMRFLMKRRGMKLEVGDSMHPELVEMFNSDKSEEEFLEFLKSCRKDAPRAVSYLIRKIGEMEI